MAQCQKCQALLDEKAPFCMHCGRPSSPVSWRVRYLPYLVGGLVVVVVTVFAAYGGYLKIGGNQSASFINKSGQLDSQGDGLKVVQGALPNDVRLWLEHLKRVDDERVALQNNMVGKLNSQIQQLYTDRILDLTEDEPETVDAKANEFKKKRSNKPSTLVKEVDKEFRYLITEFQSLSPPSECLSISDQYNSALIGCMESTVKLLSILGKAFSSQSSDTSELFKMQGESYKTVDTPVSKANGLIQSICDKYGATNKYELFVETKSSKIGVPGSGLDEILKGFGGGK